MKKVARRVSRFFRRDDFRPQPVLVEEDVNEMTALPNYVSSTSVAENVGCLAHLLIKKKYSAPMFSIEEDSEITQVAESTRELPENISRLPATIKSQRMLQRSRSTPNLSTLQSHRASSLVSKKMRTVKETVQRPEKTSMISLKDKMSGNMMSELESEGFTMNTSPSIMPRTRLSRSSSEAWTTVDESAAGNGLVSSEKDSLSRPTLRPGSYASRQQTQLRDSSRNQPPALCSDLHSKKELTPEPLTTVTQQATKWADLDSSFSDGPSALQKLRQELHVPSRRISTPSLTSHRRMRAAQAARTASGQRENEAQVNKVFFDPRFVPGPEPSSTPPPQPFRGRGFVGSIASLPQTPEPMSPPPISPRLLSEPLPTNVIELLRETTDRVERELTRLRLNIRIMNQTTVNANKKIAELKPALANARKEWVETAERFMYVVMEAERLDVNLQGIDGVEESIFEAQEALGYEADMYAQMMAMPEPVEPKEDKGTAKEEMEAMFEGDEAVDEGYTADESGADEIGREEETRSAKASLVTSPSEYLVKGALQFEGSSESK